jgi:hypothetical protein
LAAVAADAVLPLHVVKIAVVVLVAGFGIYRIASKSPTR